MTQVVKKTYERNNPGSRFILADVFSLKEKELQATLGLKKDDDNLVMIGCSPCQYWSIIRTDKTKSSKSKNLLGEFERFVNFFNPGYILVENVPGILMKKDKSGLDSFIANLEQRGYRVHFEIVNMNDYGVPQKRRRFSLLATRLHSKAIFPKPTTRGNKNLGDVLGVKNGFKKISAGHRDPTEFNHSTTRLTEKNLRRLKKTPKNGGSRLSWAKDKSLKRQSYLGNGFTDNYGRMQWDKPAPTITTKFTSISNGRFGHPTENRAISIREGATLQTFPKTYKFIGSSIASITRMIGNAVPPSYAKRIGLTLTENHGTRR